MSDIDFDELDRAVASVLSTDPKKTAQVKTESAQSPAEGTTSNIAEVENAVEDDPFAGTYGDAAPEAAAEVFEPAPSPDEKPEPSVNTVKPVAMPAQALHPPISKPVQRGRFLDMIHPSHDMSPRTAVPSRRNAPVSPAANQTFVSDVLAPKTEAVVAADAEEMPRISPKEVAVTPPTEPVLKPAEPVDFFAGAPAENDEKTVEPVQSPFIADAKVEKRPLGAFSAEEGLGGNSEKSPIGNELHGELVKLESEDNIVETAESAFSGKGTVLRPAKIEKPTATEPVSTSLDDTAAKESVTPAPNLRVDSPGKHKSTIIWVTVAIAVMLIGFGVGATLYFVVL